MDNYDFSGWATRANVKCSDGRTIMKDAFINNDGTTVPLVWNHQHNDPFNVLGHALLKNMDEGVYAYCKFNDSEAGKMGREMIRNGDVKHLSIYANQLKQQGGNVWHGAIREVSLVLAGANPDAYIDSVMCHSADSDDGTIFWTDEDIELVHSEEPDSTEEEVLAHANNNADENGEGVKKEDKPDMAEPKEEIKKEEPKEEVKEKTVKDVLDTFTEEQMTVMYAIVGQALEDAASEKDTEETEEVKHSEGGNEIMHKNVFENENVQETNYLSHADMDEILTNARAVGSFQKAVKKWGTDHLQHGFGAEEGETIDVLFADVKDAHPGAPVLLERDMDWVAHLMAKANKSPVPRVRTRMVDARIAELTAKAHKKGEQKKNAANVKLLKRETHPQTVYIKDSLHRDDVLDIDFDAVAYMRNIMKHTLEETVAMAALVGDFRNEDGDKISDQNIRPIWTDEDVFTIHEAVDIAAMKAKLQGTNTAANFGDEFVYAEAIIAHLMNARINYKGKGAADFYCAPELMNKMLLARDMNGRRIYESKADLAKALNVNNIFDVDQFNELTTREDAEGNKFKLLGIFVNMANYQFGCSKGGEITSFEDFDIDYNQYKYLMETRLSGALIDPYSAIVLEEPVAAG
jgi:HK97 family phage prohead protease